MAKESILFARLNIVLVCCQLTNSVLVLKRPTPFDRHGHADSYPTSIPRPYFDISGGRARTSDDD